MLMLKMIDVVAAIIEQDGQILLAQRPPHAVIAFSYDERAIINFVVGSIFPCLPKD